MTELNFFDPGQEFFVVERQLPHRAQAGVVCFMTYRMRDSLPSSVVERCLQEREDLLRLHGIDPAGNWRAELNRLRPAVRHQVQWAISERWDTALDDCHGSCVLKRPELSRIVAGNLRHLDGTDYELTDFVVMPNHVHVLGESGHFWQEDGFDHLVRSPEQFEHYRRYIANNPVKARLKAGEFVLYSKAIL